MKDLFIFAGAPYSNSAPLVEKLAEADPRVRVINDHPANLVSDLTSGHADVALIPVAHLFAHPELMMLDGLGVAADGPVKSVLLKCNQPVGKIKTVERDPASATSNALVALLMERHFQQPVTMCGSGSIKHPDAAVVIGDRALCSDPAPAGDIDLAGAWKQMTGLPFVFAAWVVRRDFPHIAAVGEIARKAFAAGFRSVEQIAARYAARLGRPVGFWLDYLTVSVHYELTPRDREGMELFRTLLAEEATPRP